MKRIVRRCKPHIKRLALKYKPQLYYMLFGTITGIIDVVMYQLCFVFWHIGNVLSYTIAWFLSVAFSFVTNKIWVYGSRSRRLRTVVNEILAYFLGRAFSFVVGVIIIWYGVSVMKWNSLAVKLASEVIVIAMNYGFGFMVFQKIEEHIEEKMKE